MTSASWANDGAPLAEEIRACFPAWRVRAVRRAATGLEATVFRVETEALGPLAVKVPLTRFIHNANDQGLDARDLLRQDARMFTHLRAHGLPAPEVIALQLGDELDFLAYRFVEADDSACSAEAVGRLLRRLHEAPLPGWLPVAHRHCERVEPVLSRLTHERLRTIRSLVSDPLPQTTAALLEEALLTHRPARTLLHMDMRAPNLLCVRGDVVALIDWSNALIADPVIELARVAEYGWPMDEIARGYGSDLLAGAAPRAAAAARLYTAAMLALVFLSEAPDARRAPAAVARVRALVDELA